MEPGGWLSLLKRHCEPDWDEILVGHDFGLLVEAEIRAWSRGAGRELDCGGPSFEACLWAAVREATGKTPRPGSRRWERAQDRWRVAMLKDAMEAPVGPEALAILVEAVYENLGCPEDMLGLWRRRAGRPEADRDLIRAFIRRREDAGVPA